MKFSISVSLERFDPALDMRVVSAQALELVQMAEDGGFEIAWTPEHHTIEFTIAPNPFTVLTHWAAHTRTIRLGTAVVVAPYWHPIRVAGEAALCDVFSNGRLEFGIGRGAYQFEFDRMAGGIPQQQGGAYMREMLPAVKSLWQGDYEHRGTYWGFPSATAVPKPLQKPHPPIWVAARDLDTFDWAIKRAPIFNRRHCRAPTARSRSSARASAKPSRSIRMSRGPVSLCCAVPASIRIREDWKPPGPGVDRARPPLRESVQEHRHGAQRVS